MKTRCIFTTEFKFEAGRLILDKDILYYKSVVL